VTSRVRLALPGEWLLPLSGLPWPDAEDVDRFEAFDAVQLFVRAAQRVEPALVPPPKPPQSSTSAAASKGYRSRWSSPLLDARAVVRGDRQRAA
jgi:hypothetical protein